MIEFYGENWLVCPRCGAHEMHQTAVEVFERLEDSGKGLHVLVTHPGYGAGRPPGEVKVDGDLSKNPSRRRHGLLITFVCEHCPNIEFTLAIIQHKGITLVDWVYPGQSNGVFKV